MANAKPQNVVQVDDRNGSHYWIFTVHHTTGTATDIEVDNSVVSAAEIPVTGTGGTVTITADDSATDAVREITVDSGEATGTKTIVARFIGSAAGSSSSKNDL